MRKEMRESRFSFERFARFPQENLIFAGIAGNGFLTYRLPGRWEFDTHRKVYRKVSDEGWSWIAPTHVFEEKGFVVEYALLFDGRGGGRSEIVYWVRPQGQ